MHLCIHVDEIKISARAYRGAHGLCMKASTSVVQGAVSKQVLLCRRVGTFLRTNRIDIRKKLSEEKRQKTKAQPSR